MLDDLTIVVKGSCAVPCCLVVNCQVGINRAGQQVIAFVGLGFNQLISTVGQTVGDVDTIFFRDEIGYLKPFGSTIQPQLLCLIIAQERLFFASKDCPYSFFTFVVARIFLFLKLLVEGELYIFQFFAIVTLFQDTGFKGVNNGFIVDVVRLIRITLCNIRFLGVLQVSLIDVTCNINRSVTLESCCIGDGNGFTCIIVNGCFGIGLEVNGKARIATVGSFHCQGIVCVFTKRCTFNFHNNSIFVAKQLRLIHRISNFEGIQLSNIFRNIDCQRIGNLITNGIVCIIICAGSGFATLGDFLLEVRLVVYYLNPSGSVRIKAVKVKAGSALREFVCCNIGIRSFFHFCIYNFEHIRNARVQNITIICIYAGFHESVYTIAQARNANLTTGVSCQYAIRTNLITRIVYTIFGQLGNLNPVTSFLLFV